MFERSGASIATCRLHFGQIQSSFDDTCVHRCVQYMVCRCYEIMNHILSGAFQYIYIGGLAAVLHQIAHKAASAPLKWHTVHSDGKGPDPGSQHNYPTLDLVHS